MLKGLDVSPVASFHDLLDLSRSPEIGLYLAPVPRTERLHSNLVPLIKFPDHMYVASTCVRSAREVWAAFRQENLVSDGAWILREKNIIAFHDLSDPPWSIICDQGTVETFDSSDWATTDDADQTRQFVQLLNQTLRTQLAPDVRYWPREDCYAHVAIWKKAQKGFRIDP